MMPMEVCNGDFLTFLLFDDGAGADVVPFIDPIPLAEGACHPPTASSNESSVCSVCDWVSVDFVNGKFAAAIGSLESIDQVRSVCVAEVCNCNAHA